MIRINSLAFETFFLAWKSLSHNVASLFFKVNHREVLQQVNADVVEGASIIWYCESKMGVVCEDLSSSSLGTAIRKGILCVPRTGFHSGDSDPTRLDYSAIYPSD